MSMAFVFPGQGSQLYDEPRVGGPRTITDEEVEALIVQTLETTPKVHTHWSTRKMAAKAGISHTMVGRIWRTFGLKPHISRSYTMSPDPQFVAKVRDVVGLYMNPPHNAVVFSFDEKSQIQALQRAQPILPMDLGQPERQTHNYIATGRSTCSPRSTSRRARSSRPFKWTKTADEILDKVKRFGVRTQQVHGR